ncbi:hypothetical protein PP637_gp59 [Arthrobacter phage Persistence]|uniref:Uncharacterized protein n=1 Tax=Arthrobacter phage Persistence TaxID=2836007 RepID=A0A8F3IIC6_9CAUD|nr:hypothetical protein PP637_gp59 [Arthrobacter phage Persistence]QWY79688.1 hypothetical protein SEA_PERSISTENCE_59 [Arthrobacter phage Persistence]
MTTETTQEIHPLTQALIEKGVVFALPCCPRLTRPANRTKASAPGTIRRKNSRECDSCYREQQAKKRAESPVCRNEIDAYIASRRARGIPAEGISYLNGRYLAA